MALWGHIYQFDATAHEQHLFSLCSIFLISSRNNLHNCSDIGSMWFCLSLLQSYLSFFIKKKVLPLDLVLSTASIHAHRCETQRGNKKMEFGHTFILIKQNWKTGSTMQNSIESDSYFLVTNKILRFTLFKQKGTDFDIAYP